MRVLIVGEFDFSALEFQRKYKGTKVIDIMNDINSYLPTDEDDGEWELTVEEIDCDIPSDNFISFAKSFIDYEHSKDVMWYTENETI